MYHIKNDLRSRSSSIKIYKSLRKLLLVKKLENISISDIKEECGISRSTFYRNFDCINDVLEMKFVELIEKYLKQQKTTTMNSIEYFFTFWNLHSDLVYIIYHQDEGIIQKIFRQYLKESAFDDNEVLNDYFLAYKIATITSLLCKWVDRNKKETPKEMVNITLSLFAIKNSDLLTKI